MAKSTTPKKGATKKVALKEEIAQVIPSAESPVNPEPKKVKRVSIAKPKALIEKNAKSETVIKVKEQIVEKSSKTPKRTSKKSVTKSEPDFKDEKTELPQKQVKSKGPVSRKLKHKQVDETVSASGLSKINDMPEENTLLEQSTLGDDSQSIDTDGFAESSADALLKGEERLSRKERRLREWKERKKLKRLQHLQERQQTKIVNEEVEPKHDKMTVIEPATKEVEAKTEIESPVDTAPQVIEKKQIEKIQVEKKQQSDKVIPQKNLEQSSKLLPLDKADRDFPTLKKVETWGNAMSKAKVEPLPKQLEPILQKTIHFMEQEIKIKKPSVILVGVSGGIDSVVLLDLLSVISTRGWCTIHVAHCNHQLRGEASHQDELHVRRLASKYGLHFHHTSADVAGYSKDYNLGIETAARIMRYQFFEKAAKASHADVIATAHHSEDNAETLLMNLMRGSGITGLAGIPPRRDLDKKLSYIRPILWLSKKEIEHYAKVRNLEWREDESNTELNFTRNKIRHELLPMLRAEYSPGLTEVLNRTTTLMREAQEFIAERIIHIMKQGVREISKTSFAINIGMFQTIKDFAKGELIQASLRYYLRMQPISMVAIDSILNIAQGPAGGRLDITKDLFVIRDREELIFARPEQGIEVFMPVMKLGNFSSNGIGYHGEIADPRSVNFGEHPLIEYFDAEIFPEQCVIRHWRDGDRITPIGMEGSMTVSDFLTNAKINVADKRKVLVLCSGDEVLWIIGYRIHNGFKVTQQTSSIMRISISLDKQINYMQSHSQKHQPKPQQKNQNKAQQKKQSADNLQKNANEQVINAVQEPVLAPIEKKSKNMKPNPRAPKKSSRPAKDA
jgi:tRNA(Ile)-lysidine synthase